ncbi:MAG: MOSC domain-containing protein [Oscillibacter sp.]|nr:MOSC domain-containing protein [Oscillibacter sp.]
MAVVISVNISEQKGTVKREVPEIQLKLRHGIVGDAHAGDWHRQISLLAEESVDKMRSLLPELQPGAFAENINTRGLELKSLPVGTRLRLGETVVEVTQIGKECHSDCEIKKRTGKCVMPTEGIFAVVVKEGTVRKGDPIEIVEEAKA